MQTRIADLTRRDDARHVEKKRGEGEEGIAGGDGDGEAVSGCVRLIAYESAMRKPRRVETKLAEHAEGERERYFSRARDLLFLGLISFRVECVAGRLRGARCLDPGDSVIATPGRIRLRESNFGEWQLASGQRRLTAEKRRPPPRGVLSRLYFIRVIRGEVV